MSLSDVELIKQSLSGDKAAFGKLMKRYSALAGGVALGVLRDYGLAGDAVQDAFLKAWNNLDSLKKPSSFKSWLCGIVKTTSIDHLRKEKGVTVPMSVAQQAAENVAAGRNDDNPVKKLESEELHNRIMDAIYELPETYREVVILKHIEERSYKEIAEILDLTIATIESRLFRGRQMVAETIKKYLED